MIERSQVQCPVVPSSVVVVVPLSKELYSNCSPVPHFELGDFSQRSSQARRPLVATVKNTYIGVRAVSCNCLLLKITV